MTTSLRYRPDKWGVGLHYGATDQSMDLVELALAAQDRGLDSVFLPEHSHIPTSRRTPYPGGGDIPERYLRLWDPLVALSFVAARTDLVVGTCVALPGVHDPIAYAKAAATLDVQSGGRLVLGIGFGWNDDELADHGIAAETKYAAVTEKVELMRRLWTADEADYDGEFYRLPPSWAWPKPLQRPHPPILLGGGANRATFRRVARFADGWIPMTMAPEATLKTGMAGLQAEWNAAGREGLPRVMVMQAPGPASMLRPLLERYRDLGVARVLVDVPSEGADVLLPVLDEIGAACQEHASAGGV